MVVRKILRYLWAAPWTACGVLLGAGSLLSGARVQWQGSHAEFLGGGLIAVWRRCPGCCGFGAITLGHVVLAVDRPTADALRAHERVHVDQYERWGPLFVPAYFCASAWAWLRGGDPHRDNAFEREACRA